ncbi:MAG: hypothetical protein KatS3mg021_2112 [Fimbriimonadales bacterium]|nr:MAG: hypothetical protein KatS3mg021_2112 [Fimbriimonadales bacterium]
MSTRRRVEYWGGDWTEKKLIALEKYIKAWLEIMKCYGFTKIYVDGFAGTGYRYAQAMNNEDSQLQLPMAEEDEVEIGNCVSRSWRSDGSVKRVLRIEKPVPFDRYIFIDIDPSAVSELENIRNDFSQKGTPKDIQIVQQDANQYLQQWCTDMGNLERAVVFLDPFGLQVEWATIEAIARTEKIDCWLLIPLGTILRMLPRKGHIGERAYQTLTRFFGDEAWRDRLHRPDCQGSLFDKVENLQRVVYEEVVDYLVERLLTIFPEEGVVKNPLILKNSKNSPISLFAFAASNKKGATTAVRIASYIIGKARS